MALPTRIKWPKAQKVLAMILVFTFTSTLFAQEAPVVPEQKEVIQEQGKVIQEETYETGKIEGRISAGKNYSSAGWFAAGVGGGFLLGLIGTGIVVGMSQSGTVEPGDEDIMNVSDKNGAFRSGFFDGYSKKAKSKKLISSLLGGCIGTAAVVAIVVSAQD